MATRSGFVAKTEHFSLQNGDEIRARRQKMVFLASKWRRDRVSSPKNSGFHFKTATRSGFVAKKWCFSPQNGDENRARRQKMVFLVSKW